MANTNTEKIALDLRRRVYHGLVALAGRIESCEAVLKSEGFLAYEPLRTWIESLACRPEEVDQFRLYLRGMAEEALGNARIASLTGEPWPPDDYVSPIMTQLRKWRDDRNGLDVWSLLKNGGPDTSWKSEMCACLANRQRLLIESAETREKALSVVTSMRLCFEQEAFQANYSQDRNQTAGADILRGLYASVESAFVDFGSQAGFSVPKRSRNTTRPSCSLSLADGWQLRFGVAYPGLHPWGEVPRSLHFCRASFEGSRESDRDIAKGSVLPIRYEFLAPYGFSSAYGSFNSEAQLYHLIRAHLRLLAVVIEDISRVLNEAIEDHD